MSGPGGFGGGLNRDDGLGDESGGNAGVFGGGRAGGEAAPGEVAGGVADAALGAAEIARPGPTYYPSPRPVHRPGPTPHGDLENAAGQGTQPAAPPEMSPRYPAPRPRSTPPAPNFRYPQRHDAPTSPPGPPLSIKPPQARPAISPEQLDANQREAIETASWRGSIEATGLMRNPAMWVVIIGILAGAAAAYNQLIMGYAPVYGGAIATAAVELGVAGMIWWVFLRWQDRYFPLPRSLVWLAFGWGALAACMALASFANTAALSIESKLAGGDFAGVWGPGMTAPFTEELSKAAGVLLLMAAAPRIIRTPYNGFILGAFVGLGFQLMEDVTYAGNSAMAMFGVDQEPLATASVATRLATGIVSHALYTALTGAAVVWLLGPRRVRNYAWGIGALVAAMASHCVWDAAPGIASAVFGSPGYAMPIIMIPLMLLDIALVLLVSRAASQPDRMDLRALLGPEVARGVVTPGELTALTGTHKQRREFKRYTGLSHGGVREVLAAVRGLALEIVADRGAGTHHVEMARHRLYGSRGWRTPV
jgi:RsiW-degrading membrane proteinase PrsW (M82 family)